MEGWKNRGRKGKREGRRREGNEERGVEVKWLGKSTAQTIGNGNSSSGDQFKMTCRSQDIEVK